MSVKKCKESGCTEKAIYESGYCAKHQKEFENIVGKDNVNNIKTNRDSIKEEPKLIKCPACGKKISSEAEICINCGHPISKEEKIISHNYNKMKCPTCGSSNVKKISKASKVKTGILLGVFSIGKVSKTFKCNNCGYKW